MLKANKIIGIIIFPGKKYLYIERKTSGLQEKQLLDSFFRSQFFVVNFCSHEIRFFLLHGRKQNLLTIIFQSLTTSSVEIAS